MSDVIPFSKARAKAAREERERKINNLLDELAKVPQEEEPDLEQQLAAAKKAREERQKQERDAENKRILRGLKPRKPKA